MKTVIAITTLTAASLFAADKEKVFSGPQPGEKVTPFEVRVLTAQGPGDKRDPIKAAGDRPVVLVFLHGLERSMAPLMRVVDHYGADQKAKLNTEFIFLIDDPIQGDRGLPRVVNSLKTRAQVGYSLDGIEGPGNYGLNKECLMTLVLAKNGKVTANFALVQPGIADAPGIIAAMAKLAGDKKPPTAEALLARQNPNQRRPMRRPLNLERLDLSTDAARQQAIRKLIAEVKFLRQQQPTNQRPKPRPKRPNTNAPKKPLPGAVPTDGRLVGMLRQFIQKTNTDADVDRVLTQMKTRAGDDADLLQQACDGLTRVIFVNYGTPYAQKSGRAFIGRHSKK
ncbi:MAG TPA: hypothetical protein EYQ62_06615 [Verrucomicrobiales bacterium]|jgi:hypothetical protein|nr:hypothetical protein [Verrucomicrobiales bacterium]HIL25460.1 hypothetical protein [Verrucomicrobiota bacterium]